jgi:colanic acid biosynthesis glycosyl transferase WcaI
VKILIQSINYPPESISTGKYNGEMAEWLAAKGHQVTMITAPPYYPQWQIWKGYSAVTYSVEIIHQVKVIRCPLWVPKKLSTFKRILHLLSFTLSAAPVVFWQIVKEQPDIVIVIQPYFFAAPWIRLVSLFSNSKIWLHIQDYEIDTAFELGFLKFKWLRRFATLIENRLLRSVARVSTVSSRMMERLILKGVCPEKTFFFPNWVDTQTIFPLDSNEAFRQQLGLTAENFVALYAGNMGVKQGLDLVIKAAKKLIDHKHIVFVLCGEGAQRKQLFAEAQGLNNIKWIPLQPYKQLNQLLNIADIHLLPQLEDAADLVMPSKLSGMLASGRPVLTTAHQKTQVAEIVKNAGLVVPPNQVDLFVEALLKLASDTEKRILWGKQARTIAIQQWDKERILTQFEQGLLNCIEL